MPKRGGGLEELLTEGLQDLFDAEKQLVKALPRMAKAANDEQLESALAEHLEMTKTQVQRLERIFASMDMPAKSKPCKGMRGIVDEGREMIEEDHEGAIMDASIVEASRKVEHYEIASYESARSLAQQLGMNEAVQLLSETLQEEVQTDRQLAQIGKKLLKDAASSARIEGEEEEQPRTARHRSTSRTNARSASARGSHGGASRSGSTAKRSSGKATARSASGRSRSAVTSHGSSGHSAHPLTDHEEIRNWAEERGASPACVRGTGGGSDTGMIRLDFPGYSGEESLEHISWDDWFEKFDESNLALIVQDTTSGGQKSNFNRLVSREGGQRKERAKAAR